MNELQKSKSGNKTKGVAKLQQSLPPSDISDGLAVLIAEYVEKTEIPILSEFAANYGIYEEFIVQISSERLKVVLKILDNKKRAALERKIYSAELNATIGGQLLKSWRENPIPEQPIIKYWAPSIQEFDAAGISDEDIKAYQRIMQTMTPKYEPT